MRLFKINTQRLEELKRLNQEKLKGLDTELKNEEQKVAFFGKIADTCSTIQP
jgi:hypothetical protein